MRRIEKVVIVAVAAIFAVSCGRSEPTTQELADDYSALFNDVAAVVRETVPVRSTEDFNQGAKGAGLAVRAEQMDDAMECFVDGNRAMIYDPMRNLTFFSRSGCSVDMKHADVAVFGIRDAVEALEGDAVFQLMLPQMEPVS